MKPVVKSLVTAAVAFILVVSLGMAYGQTADENFVTIKGVVKDATTREKVVFASVYVPGSSVGTVTNSEGEFILKVSKSSNAEYFEISHMGYFNKKFRITESLGDNRVFPIEQHIVMLNEVIIWPKEPIDLVRLALSNIGRNYCQVPNRMTGFYRESIRQQRDYLSITEAVVDIYKAPYAGYQSDQVKIYKGRKGDNVKIADTLMVKLQGGPNVIMLLDIVRNTDLSIALDSLENYSFEIVAIENIDNKQNFVIGFRPAVVRSTPLYNGKLYITQDNFAITRAEFSLDLSDAEKATAMFLKKKPMGLVFTPTATNYLVTYKEENGKYFLNYVRVDLKFKCDWKRKWFKNSYTVQSEMAITDRKEENVVRFANQDLFKTNMILTDKIQYFTDKDFWGDYNIIEPEESIENALKKIARIMKKQQK